MKKPPMAEIRGTPFRRTVNNVCAGFPNDLDFPAVDDPLTDCADAFVVERKPLPVIVHPTQQIESLRRS